MTTDTTDDAALMMEMPTDQFRKMDESIYVAERVQRKLLREAAHLKNDGRRKVWEVYTGTARTTECLLQLGADAEAFGLPTGWDFELPAHRRRLLDRFQDEQPDEVFMPPACRPWSNLQNLNASMYPELAEKLRKERFDNRRVHFGIRARHLLDSSA